MRTYVGALACLLIASIGAAEPVRLHPDNPRYFLFRGAPTVLMGSGEHYGAVINPAFDLVRYFQTLQRDRLNLTRLFVGTYLEKAGDFGIAYNTLAPEPGTALLPWARASEPGFVLGGNRFDLNRWDERYFARLRAALALADRAGVVVEVTLFSDYYGNRYSPLFAEADVNGVGDVAPVEMNTLANAGALRYQEALVRRIVRELNAFDNVIYELQNEPWASGGRTVRQVNEYLEQAPLTEPHAWKNRVEVASDASLAWQRQVAAWITDEEGRLPKRHLISQNYANFYHALADVDPAVSVVNFHYALPKAVRLNAGLDRVVSFNETGFSGAADVTYRRQAWHFLLAGGGAFNHLDFSFAVGHEGGTARNTAPGGGSAALRRQLGVLAQLLTGERLPALRPDHHVIVHAGHAVTRALSDGGSLVLAYLDGDGPSRVTLALGDGSYDAEWIDTDTGQVVRSDEVRPVSGRATLQSPPFTEDMALRITRR